MKVKLVSITKSLVEEKQMSAEQLITYVARVSNPNNQLNTDTADKLLGFLIRNKHWSPFEMVDMTVEVVTSRGIAQQILRHRSFSFQEFSQRYAEVIDMEPVQLRKQATQNRQSSTEEFDPQIEPDVTASQVVANVVNTCQLAYKELLAAGVAKECARMVLPITTQTKIYMKGSIRSWIHYLAVRLDPHTQWEHQQVAIAVWEIFEDVFPMTAKALLTSLRDFPIALSEDTSRQ